MARQQEIEVNFNGLSNTRSQARVGIDAGWGGQNWSVRRERLEGGPRYGTVWQHSGYNAGDESGGMFLARYGGTEELVAVIKKQADSTATAYLVNLTNGTWTQITGATGLAWDSSNPENNVWSFAQYEDFIYCGSPAAGLWMRRIGGPFGSAPDPLYRADDHWRPFNPEYVAGGSSDLAELERPPYDQLDFGGSDTFASVNYYTSANPRHTLEDSANSDGTVTMNDDTYSEHARIYHSLEYNSAQDISDVDWLFFTLRPTFKRDTEWIRSVEFFGINLQATKTTLTRTFALGLEYIECQAIFSGDVWYFIADIRNVDPALKASFQQIVIDMRDFTWRPFEAQLAVMQGGAWMWDVAGDPPETEYAYAYYNSTDQTYTNAVRGSLAEYELDGDRIAPGGDYGGAWVSLTAPYDATAAGNGYNQVRFFRFCKSSSIQPASIGRDAEEPTPPTPPGPTGGSDTGAWHLLGTVANSGSPALIDKNRETVARTLPTVELDFDAYASGLTAEYVALWKQHLVLAQDRKLFFSYSGQPRRFIPPPEVDFIIPDTNPDTMARTLYMSPGRTESVRTVVGADMVYASGKTRAFYMVGDTASTATPTREYPGGKGALSGRAAAKYERGVVVAAEDALWYFETQRASFDAADDVVADVELTKDIRDSWEWLKGSDASQIVVAVHESEIWVFNETRFLHLDRERADGRQVWEPGTLTVGAGAWISDPTYGFRVMFLDGRIAKFGREFTTDNGTSATFTYTSGQVVIPRGTVKKVFLYGAGDANVSIIVDDGLRAGSAETVALTRSEGQYWFSTVNCPPGVRVGVQVTGTVGEDTVEKLVLVVEPEGPGYGN